METIQELRATFIAKFDELAVIKQSNANTILGKTEKGIAWVNSNKGKEVDDVVVEAMLKAGHITSSITPEIAEKAATLIKDINGIAKQLDVKAPGTKNPRDVSDQTNFVNTLDEDNSREAAYALMTEKLKGVDPLVYQYINYEPDHKNAKGFNDGLFTMKVQTKGGIQKNASAGSWVTLAYNNPGSLANKVKEHRHMNGKLKEVITAS